MQEQLDQQHISKELHPQHFFFSIITKRIKHIFHLENERILEQFKILTEWQQHIQLVNFHYDDAKIYEIRYISSSFFLFFSKI